MEKFIVTGGTPLHGEIKISGAKNVALKILIASLLTDEEIIIHNVPFISDVFYLLKLLKSLGVSVKREGHTVIVQNGNMRETSVPLEAGARVRTSSLVLGPLLARYQQGKVPNPGGCRLGARPIDRQIEGFRRMGAKITYNSSDGYFYASCDKLQGATYEFPKNTHTGTEALILGAVLAAGTTVLKNAAAELEIDDLITCLNQMGAKIRRTKPREITIVGVERLHGTEYTIMPDRNEEVTFAIAAAITKGDIIIKNSQRNSLASFLQMYQSGGAQYEELSDTVTRYFTRKTLAPTDVITDPHPGFMTDWQAPWVVLMTQAKGKSTLHETVFESRFSYVGELRKMGAQIEFYDPEVENPKEFYNFNWEDQVEDSHQAVSILGPARLHNAVLDITDLRAGATLVLAALAAEGKSYIHGVEQIDRGYEKIEERLGSLGADIKRVTEEVIT